MIQRLSGQLPAWARLEHPALRYGLGKTRALPKRAQYLRALMYIMVILALGAAGYLASTRMLGVEISGPLREQPAQHATETLLAVVFWPVLAVQVLTRLGVLAMTVNTVNAEKRRQTWDSLRATEHGAELTLRARWAAIFYRLKGLIGLLMLVRVALIIGILVDLTAFRGGYLDRLINGVVPEVPLIVSVVLLAFLMTSSLLLPLTGIGLDAALGLLVSVVVNQRVYTAMFQIFFIFLRLALVIGLFIAMHQFVNGELKLSDEVAWLLVIGFAATGDWALSLLNLSFYGELWAIIPYGIFIGLGLLIFALIQAVVTDGILAYAVRRAERIG
jgi:hypothetical protein